MNFIAAKDKHLEDTKKQFLRVSYTKKLRFAFNTWLNASKHQQFARQFYEENLSKR